MPTFTAPKLYHDGEKILPKGFWAFDPDLISFIHANSTPTEFMLMLYLIGNSGSGNWVCSDLMEKTGIKDRGNLSKAKTKLKAKGWITYKGQEEIRVKLNNIYFQMNATSAAPSD